MNCDRIARYYKALEHLSFGRSLEKSRFAFLREAGASRRAVLCGGGDGRFLARLLCENSRVEVDFVDLSPRMIALAARRVAGMGRVFQKRVRFHCADIRKFKPRPEGYDLIVTHFFLDCFAEEELAQVVARLASCGAPQGRWIVSDFREADGLIGRIWTGAIIHGLYAAFRLTTVLHVSRLPDYAAALVRGGYLLRCEKRALGGLLHSSLWEVCTPREGSERSSAEESSAPNSGIANMARHT